MASCEFGFQQYAVMCRAIQDRLPPQVDPRLAMLQDALDHELGLFVFVQALHQIRQRSGLAFRPQVLLKSLGGQSDHLVRRH